MKSTHTRLIPFEEDPVCLKSFNLVNLRPINLNFRGNSSANNSLPVYGRCLFKRKTKLAKRTLTLYSSSFVETQRSNDFARVKTTTIRNRSSKTLLKWTHLDMYQVYISMSLCDLSNHFVPYLSQVLQRPRLASPKSSLFDQSEKRFCNECENLNLIMKNE